MTSQPTRNDGLAVWSRARPTSVYVAFRGVPSLVEVYSPGRQGSAHACASPGGSAPSASHVRIHRMDDNEDRYRVAGMADHPTPAPVTEPSASLVPAVAAGLVAAIVGGIAWGVIVEAERLRGRHRRVGHRVHHRHGHRARHPGRQGHAPAGDRRHLRARRGTARQGTSAMRSSCRKTQSPSDRASACSSDMFSFFRDDLDAVFGLFDLLWIGLAVFTAWRIPQVDEPEPGDDQGRVAPDPVYAPQRAPAPCARPDRAGRLRRSGVAARR